MQRYQYEYYSNCIQIEKGISYIKAAILDEAFKDPFLPAVVDNPATVRQGGFQENIDLIFMSVGSGVERSELCVELIQTLYPKGSYDHISCIGLCQVTTYNIQGKKRNFTFSCNSKRFWENLANLITIVCYFDVLHTPKEAEANLYQSWCSFMFQLWI